MIKEENKKSYSYRLIIDNNLKTHEEWTGKWPTLHEALAWKIKYGKFHKDNGHELQLFKNSSIPIHDNGQPIKL